MKIAVFGLDIDPGKFKFENECFRRINEKFSPDKSTAYSVEFIGEDFDKADASVYCQDKKIDFLLIDLEKIERRMGSCDSSQKKLLIRCQEILEKEVLICDEEFSQQDHEILKASQLVTYKPSVASLESEDINRLIQKVLDKTETILFFTITKNELRAWGLKKGATALDAAAKIHSDLARGFIKAEVVNCRDLDSFFNMAEARSKGICKVVTKDYEVQDGDIIEIKFSV
ncbi:MAG: DUF933 domain-containing protein [Candidatus Omnitrophota bacterium]